MEIFPQQTQISPVTLRERHRQVTSCHLPRAGGRVRAREAGILPTLTAVRYVPRSIPCYDITLVYRLNAVSHR